MYQPVPTKRKPGWITFFCVVALLLGLLGMLSNVFVIASPFVAEFLNGMTGDQGLTEDMIKARDELQAMEKAQYIPNLIFALMNFVVAGLLIVGAVVGLNRKPSAPKLLGMAFLMAIVFNVLRLIYTLVFTIKDMDKSLELSLAQAGPEAESLKAFAEITAWIVLGLSVLFTLGIMLFYFLGWLKMKNPEVVAWFEAAKQS